MINLNWDGRTDAENAKAMQNYLSNQKEKTDWQNKVGKTNEKIQAQYREMIRKAGDAQDEQFEKEKANFMLSFGASALTGNVLDIFTNFIKMPLNAFLSNQKKEKIKEQENQIKREIIDLRKTQLQEAKELQKDQNEIDRIKQEIEKNKPKEITPATAPTPTPTTRPITENKSTNIKPYLYVASGASAIGSYFVRKNKPALFSFIVLSVVFLIVAIFVTNKKKPTEPTKEQAKEKEPETKEKEIGAVADPFANLDFSSFANFNFLPTPEQIKAQAEKEKTERERAEKERIYNKENGIYFNNGIRVIPEYLPEEDVNLWANVGIDLTQDVYAQYVTYCPDPYLSAENNIAFIDNICNPKDSFDLRVRMNSPHAINIQPDGTIGIFGTSVNYNDTFGYSPPVDTNPYNLNFPIY